MPRILHILSAIVVNEERLGDLRHASLEPVVHGEAHGHEHREECKCGEVDFELEGATTTSEPILVVDVVGAAVGHAVAGAAGVDANARARHLALQVVRRTTL